MTTEMIPEWDLGDRMRKSLRHADLEFQQMADYLGVSRNSISNWINGKTRPNQPALRLWAMRTGVPYEWLREGQAQGVRRPGYSSVRPLTWAVAA